MGYNAFTNKQQAAPLSGTAQKLMTKVAACGKARKQTIQKKKMEMGKTAAMLLLTGLAKH